MVKSDTRAIGVFDSGSGGLSVLQSIQLELPLESFIYLGDHINLPYGEKSMEFIRERTKKAIEFFQSKNVKLVVIACNTATIAGIEWYREQFPVLPIVGVVPVIKTAAAMTRTKHILVLSTQNTAKSTYQKNLISQFASDCAVSSLGSSHLVPLIESGHLDDKEIMTELSSILSGYQQGVDDVIVLGCTHYPFIVKSIRAIVGSDISILDSGGAVARQVSRILTERNELATHTQRPPSLGAYTTGDANSVSGLFRKLIQNEISVTHVDI